MSVAMIPARMGQDRVDAHGPASLLELASTLLALTLACLSDRPSGPWPGLWGAASLPATAQTAAESTTPAALVRRGRMGLCDRRDDQLPVCVHGRPLQRR